MQTEGDVPYVLKCRQKAGSRVSLIDLSPLCDKSERHTVPAVNYLSGYSFGSSDFGGAGGGAGAAGGGAGACGCGGGG